MSRGSSLIIVGRTPRSLTLDWKWPSLASKPWLLLCLFTIGSGSKWTAVEVLWAELSHRIANELVRFPDSPQSSQSGNQLGLKLSADYIRMLAEKSDYVSFPLLHLSSFATKYEYIWTQYSPSSLLYFIGTGGKKLPIYALIRATQSQPITWKMVSIAFDSSLLS